MPYTGIHGKTETNEFFALPVLQQGTEDIHHVMVFSERETLSRSKFLQEAQSMIKLKGPHTDLVHQIFESVTRKEN